MPFQVKFIKEREGPGPQATVQTTGIVTKKVEVGDRAELIGEGWWTVVEVYELPWVPIHKWDVGGVTTRRN